MITIQTFEHNTQAQIDAYFDTLHPFKNDGRYSVTYGRECYAVFSGRPAYIKRHFQAAFEEHMYECFYCSLNATNRFMKGSKKDRDAKNLYNYDVLMFDIDAKGENLSGLEDQLVEEFLDYCAMFSFPVPNAFSYSGGGGIHIYYTIDPCYPGLGKAIKSLKYVMADKIRTFLNDYQDAYGMDYEIDSRVFDDMRLDRLPGTMNPKTGRMCEFMKTNVERYSFKKLLGFNDDLKLANWDKIMKIARNNYHYGKKKKTRLEFIKVTAKKKTTGGRDEAALTAMLKTRINGFFDLARSGYDFRGARATSCFAFRQICKNLGMDKEEEIKLLKDLNECFYEPLDEAFLLKHTDSHKSYRFTNEALAEQLGLDADDPLFLAAFRTKKKTVKEYGLNKKQLVRAQTYIDTAKALKEEPEITVREIAGKIGKTIDQVKRAAALLRKSNAMRDKWAETTLEDYNFITEYFSKNPSSNNDVPSRQKKVKIVNIDVDSVIHHCTSVVKAAVKAVKAGEKISGNRSLNNAIAACSYYINGLYSLGRNPLWEVISVLDCLPLYTARIVAWGYWDYSAEYINTLSEPYTEHGSAPKPCVKPMYDGMIRQFPKYENSVLFKYQPSILLYHFFGCKDSLCAEDYLPKQYEEYYCKYRKLIDAYRHQREQYKKAAKYWQVDCANKAVERADSIISELNDVECEYDQLLGKDVQYLVNIQYAVMRILIEKHSASA